VPPKISLLPKGGLGSRSIAGGLIHTKGCPSSFAANWPAFTSSLKANLVAIERGHDNGSITVMCCGGPWRLVKECGEAKRTTTQGEGARALPWVGGERDEGDGR
jgi:hypothetical protein